MTKQARNAKVAAAGYPTPTRVAPPPAGSVSPPSFVFKPGVVGTPPPGVYTTFETLAPAVKATPGLSTVYIDLSLVGDTFTPPAGNFDFGQSWTWIGLLNGTTGNFPTIDFANGTTISPPSKVAIDDVIIATPQAAQPVLTHAGGQFEYSFGKSTNISGTSAFILATGGRGKVWMRGLASFGAAAVANNGSIVTFEVLDQTTIPNGSVVHLAGTTTIFPASPAVTIGQALWLAHVSLIPGVTFTGSVAPGGAINGTEGCLYINKTAADGAIAFVFSHTGVWAAYA